MLSLLSISGAITTVPDMHRYLVAQHGWLSDAQFSSSVAIAQAAPGPNVLFVALMGWNVGLNAGGGIGAGPQAWLLGPARPRDHDGRHHAAEHHPDLLRHPLGPSQPRRGARCAPSSRAWRRSWSAC